MQHFEVMLKVTPCKALKKKVKRDGSAADFSGGDQTWVVGMLKVFVSQLQQV